MDKKTEQGDRIRVETSEETYDGILIPRPNLANDNYIVLKLDSGYNIGIKKAKIKKTTLLEKQPNKSSVSESEVKKDPKKPTITILSTGGTISSKVDYRTGGVYASYTAKDLLQAAPELENIANINSRFLMNVMSEDMNPKLWIKIAGEIAKELNSGIDGVVITHGTDTMHYSTAAMSFLLRNLKKPVIFTGSQRSTDRGSSDGFLNLICSVIMAKSDVAGVSLVMHGSMEDDFCYAHRGTKVRKMHTTRRDAFQSINDTPLAKIYPNGKIDILNTNYTKRENSDVIAESKLEEKVALIKIYPGMDVDIVDFYIDKGYKGLVFEGTALGHVPTTIKETSLIPKIERARDLGIIMAMTTQCLYGRVHPYVYANLRELSTRDVIYCEDMLPEVAYVKLMWILSHTTDKKEVMKMIQTNYAYEINNRSDIYETIL